MTNAQPTAAALSPLRARLCSAENAIRVANRIHEHCGRELAIVRTTNPLQPLRVILGQGRAEDARVRMVS